MNKLLTLGIQKASFHLLSLNRSQTIGDALGYGTDEFPEWWCNILVI